MSKVIRIPQTTYERLQEHAEPFRDTPADVIDRLLDYWDKGDKGKKPKNPRPPIAAPTPGRRAYQPNSPPDLHHSRLHSAEVGGESARNWNDLVAVAHRVAVRKGYKFQRLQEESLAHLKQGSFTEKGFKPCADTGFSIQAVDANNAWRNAFHLARQLQLPISATFEWHNKNGAAHPGQFGTLTWNPGGGVSE